MAAEVATRIGERIRARRLELGLKQRELADRMPEADAVSNQHISNWERAINRPSDRYLRQLADALEVDIHYFTSPDPDQGTPDVLATFASSDQPVWALRIETKLDVLLRAFGVDPAVVTDAFSGVQDVGEAVRALEAVEAELEALVRPPHPAAGGSAAARS